MRQLQTHQRTEYVYFVQVEDGGPIKIGFATNVSTRLAGLQTASPYPLRLLKAISGSRHREREIHQKFSEDRLRPNAEWFQPSPALLDFIQAVKDLPPSPAPLSPEDQMHAFTDNLASNNPSYAQAKAEAKLLGYRVMWVDRSTCRTEPENISPTIRDEIKSYIIRKGWAMKELNDALNKRQGKETSYQNFSKKLASGSFRYEDAKEIADILGYEIVWVDKK